MHSLEKQLFLVFFCHLTSSSREGFGYALKHNLGGNILGLVSTTRLWGTDNLLVTKLNSRQQTIFSQNGCDYPVATNHMFFFFGTLGMMCRVAEVVRRHEGPSPKSLSLDENFKP